MNFDDCVKFAKENPVSWFATMEGDQPRVRALGIWFADSTGFYFQISSIRDSYRQLLKNPKVEFAIHMPDDFAGTVLRVAGTAEFLDDLELKKRVMEERPFLKQFGLSAESTALIIFRVAHGEAFFWTMKTSANPKEIIKF
ncbi:MAG: hypothetical protein CSYNP_03905 [Syntrophus sp. SKADARSKE-3]|nr:hypothetical protein [Syntrophus sp. SKADARSKE-3]